MSLISLARSGVAAGLTWCLQDPERSAAEGYDISTVEKMFSKLA